MENDWKSSGRGVRGKEETNTVEVNQAEMGINKSFVTLGAGAQEDRGRDMLTPSSEQDLPSK